ncbi:MAG: amidase [Chloroflexi bacterium]|nr:amidase [Chloroflexota bacterium]
MSNLELLSQTISDVAPQVRARAISPVELVRAALEHIHTLRSSVNSFITVLDDRALQRAREMEAELARGVYRGPLHGIPFGVKDNITTAGIKTTAGSKILADWVPEEDAPVVTKMLEAGAILMGKENLCEFAAGPTGYNPHYGNIHNPWDLTRISGGSSGGSGASVASLQTFVSFGTDAGGSVRIPATLCGAVGLKATHGRVSLRGVLPPYGSVDHVGPITRSVRDAATVLQAIAGYDDLDPTSVPVPVADYVGGLERDIRGLVMGIPTNYYFELVDPEVEASVQKAITLLEELGVKVKEVTIQGIEHLRALPNLEGLVYHEKWIRERRGDYDPEVVYRMLPGQFVRAMDYAKAMRVRRVLKQEFARVMRDVDFLVSPTSPIPAFPIGTEHVTIKGQKVLVKGPGVPSRTLARNTSPSNQTGVPSITVPCGFTREGLPIGLQLIGRPFQEELLLRVAHHYETASPRGVVIPPPVAAQVR